MLYGNPVQFKQLWSNFRSKIVWIVLLIISGACTTAPLGTPTRAQFYIIPEVTYLRESPGYDEKVLTQLNQGEQVIVLENGDSPWWRVQQAPEGQTGWLQKALLSSTPVPTNFYYVNQDTLPLLTSPGNDSPQLSLLSRGDSIIKLEGQSQGWWLVRVVATGVQGWLPSAALSAQLADTQLKAPAKEYYYVAVKKLDLRAKPWIKDESIRTLKFNEQVQKIAQNSQGWFKVRLPADGVLGWVLSRYLDQLPQAAPRPESSSKTRPRILRPRKGTTTEPVIM
jgi:uncharacterized protein YgiM (DUF1202 family)